MSRLDRPGRALMTMAMATPSGAGKAAFEFCKALRAEGWSVALAWGPPGQEQELVPAVAAMQGIGVEVHQFKRPIAPTPWTWWELRTLARRIKPTLVIGVMQRDRAIALALARRLGVPGIVAAQNQHFFWGPLPLSLAKRVLYRFALSRWATLVVCASEPVRAEVLQFGVSPDRALVIPNGLDVVSSIPLGAEERGALRAELGVAPQDILLVNVGRMDLQKAQDVLVDGFVRCARDRTRVKLVVIGGVSAGPNHAKAAAFSRQVQATAARSGIGDRIHFAGWRSDVSRILGAADGYVHSARWEGFSFAVLEAWAASLPTVITDCSGHPEGFVAGEHGWIVPKGDAMALAGAMGRLCDAGPDARAAMGRACRDLLQRHYNLEVIRSRFMDAVRGVVNATR